MINGNPSDRQGPAKCMAPRPARCTCGSQDFRCSSGTQLQLCCSLGSIQAAHAPAPVSAVLPQPRASYSDWCAAHTTDHGHCPRECEHPQSFWLGERFVCGRCAIIDGELLDMIPCTPAIC